MQLFIICAAGNKWEIMISLTYNTFLELKSIDYDTHNI